MSHTVVTLILLLPTKSYLGTATSTHGYLFDLKHLRNCLLRRLLLYWNLYYIILIFNKQINTSQMI